MPQAKQKQPDLPPAPSTIEEKFKVLKAVETFLNNKFKTTTSLVRLGDRVGKPMPSISTGIPTFDHIVTQIGGLPKGRIIEVFGPESSGKTTFTLQCVAQEQKRGELAAFVDAEHALDPNYAAKLGVDVDNLIVAQPDFGEEALDTVEALIESQAVSVVVVDSVAALVPRAEFEGDMGQSHMGLQARLMSQACRKLSPLCASTGVTVIFINQIRANLGTYGSPEVTTGGRALKFYASVRLDVRKVSGEDGQIKDGGKIIGHKMRITAKKLKVGVPFRDTVVDLYYGVGIDTVADFIEYGIILGVIERNGAWFSFNGERLAQGRENAKQTIKDNPKVYEALQLAVTKAQTAKTG